MAIPISYIPLCSSVNVSFWNKLGELKIDEFKAEEVEKHIWGYVPLVDIKVMPVTLLEIDSTSFNVSFSEQHYQKFHGKLICSNTIEKFKETDKQKLINNEGLNLYEKIKNAEVLENPTLLNIFLLLTYVDVKKYLYYYWFAFPVPKNLILEKSGTYTLLQEFSEDMVKTIYKDYNALEDNHKYYFIVLIKGSAVQVCTLKSVIDKLDPTEFQIYFVFRNTAHCEGIGSQMRNYVALLLHHFPVLGTQVEMNLLAINFTRQNGTININKSKVYKVRVPKIDNMVFYNWVGWEKNDRENMGPRLANMKSTLDPAVIAENSVDLNLRLMKWNLAPKLNLEKIKKTKFLLLGAGTLGCNVARTLLGWGVRYMTFVDNAIVSTSNPVRQNLYTYQDSLDCKPKAIAAAEMVKAVFPGVTSNGIQMTIPMPGHTVSDSFKEKTREDLRKLIELIDEHDVIFLLMDSRESRWLPTMLGSYAQKIVINAALGFDSYLVMRHGIYTDSSQPDEVMQCEGMKSIKGSSLGCYFCNDVTAPGDSMKNRTLDQQCTVTRPGVSQICGALAVELAISILQHNDGILAPAFYSSNQNANSMQMEKMEPSVLGIVPHSIRGFLSSLEQFLPATLKYKNCVACSEMILTEYRNRGFEFLFQVFNSSKLLEDVAQLTHMYKDMNLSEVYEYDISDGFSLSSSSTPN